MSVLVRVPFYFCLPSDKYIGPCNWGMEGRGWGSWEKAEREKKKSGGVEGYGCFSLGDRACCHGAGPPIGGRPVQSLNSTDCFIIEKFFLSSCLAGRPFLLHLSSRFLIVTRLHGPFPGSYSGTHRNSCIPCIRHGCHCQGVSVSLTLYAVYYHSTQMLDVFTV